MKIRTIFSFIFIALTTFVWTGCVKEGPAGPAGLNGFNGLDGLDGNANVIASPWYTPNSWSGTNNDWYFDVSNTAITADIVENGAILAYVSIPGDVYDYAVRPLPAFIIGANWDFLLPNDGQSNYGEIEFTTDMFDRPGTAGYNFRFILIPASYTLKSAKLKSTKLSDLKKMPYKEVCQLFGIKE